MCVIHFQTCFPAIHDWEQISCLDFPAIYSYTAIYSFQNDPTMLISLKWLEYPAQSKEYSQVPNVCSPIVITIL